MANEIRFRIGQTGLSGIYCIPFVEVTPGDAIVLSEVPNMGGLYTNAGSITGLTVGQTYDLLAYDSNNNLIGASELVIWTGNDFMEITDASVSFIDSNLELLLGINKLVVGKPVQHTPTSIIVGDNEIVVDITIDENNNTVTATRSV